jgi:hypothetical protein
VALWRDFLEEDEQGLQQVVGEARANGEPSSSHVGLRLLVGHHFDHPRIAWQGGRQPRRRRRLGAPTGPAVKSCSMCK